MASFTPSLPDLLQRPGRPLPLPRPCDHSRCAWMDACGWSGPYLCPCIEKAGSAVSQKSPPGIPEDTQRHTLPLLPRLGKAAADRRPLSDQSASRARALWAHPPHHMLQNSPFHNFRSPVAAPARSSSRLKGAASLLAAFTAPLVGLRAPGRVRRCFRVDAAGGSFYSLASALSVRGECGNESVASDRSAEPSVRLKLGSRCGRLGKAEDEGARVGDRAKGFHPTPPWRRPVMMWPPNRAQRGRRRTGRVVTNTHEAFRALDRLLIIGRRTTLPAHQPSSEDESRGASNPKLHSLAI